MMAFEHLDGFVRSTSQAGDIPSLKRQLSSAITRLGFERFSYMILRQPGGLPGRLYFGTYPVDWSAFYKERDLWLHDPIMRQPFDTVQPFLWKQVLQRQNDRTSQMLVFGPAADAGMRAGAVVPMHGPDGGVALLAVTRDCPDAEFDSLFFEHRYSLQIIAYAAHDATMRLVTMPAFTDPPRLSPRQKEVLLWTIHGKTNWEIGEILNVTEDTVRQHLRVVCRLLGASNRTHAAAIAVSRQLILPDAKLAPTEMPAFGII